MKKFLAVVTVVAISVVSLSAFAANCGSNTGRNSNTTGAGTGAVSTTQSGGGVTR